MITDRIDAVTKIPAEYLKTVLPAPKSVKIELTGKCNFRCQFCALRTREAQPTQDMDFALFKKITTDMQRAGVQEIGLFYIGESFMNPELLVQSIEWLKKYLHMPYVFLTSNASLAFPEAVEACMAAGLNSLKWSVNAADEDQFEQVMGVKAKSMKQAKTNIKEAWELRTRNDYQTGLYASSILYDGEQRKKMKEMLETDILPFVDQHYFLPLYSMGAQTTEREEELGYKPIAGNQGRIGALRDPLPCWSAFTEGHVTSTGLMSACCFDADSKWTMGDLTKEPFMSAWNSAEYQTLRGSHLNKNVAGTPCESCVAYR